MVTCCRHASYLFNFKIDAVRRHGAREVNAAFSQPCAPNLLIAAVAEFHPKAESDLSKAAAEDVQRLKSVPMTYPKGSHHLQ